ncbi:SH3 domain-containing protein [Donghicola sp. C2-DW-16]|uniref:SH3 domain-containing protein n=1 Tax=Donghicola mangrovi TaxID=2729614 RepID=A0ABX2PAY2_9RHOB|nr:SH3 domain-containing protein [Donghicola mangrovi]NVO26266.1 SH3 domain-containing protein [Donghicola mangrovi]
MWRLIIVTFAFLAFALYELSGGAKFEPAAPVAQVRHLTPMQTATAEPVLPAMPVMGIRKPKTEESVGITLASMDAPADTPAMMMAQTQVDATVMPSVIVETSASATDEMIRDIRKVTGSRVNMRQGPGTQYSVVSSLRAGDEVEILQSPGNGWVKLQVVSSGRIGWMAERLVSSAAR